MYLLVPDAEFQRAQKVLGLPVTRIDQVVVRNIVYVLAALRGDHRAAAIQGPSWKKPSGRDR